MASNMGLTAELLERLRKSKSSKEHIKNAVIYILFGEIL